MVNNSEEANVSMTTEQLIQINTFEKRMVNLRAEMGILTKEVGIKRIEIERAMKEKMVLDELIVKLQETKTSLEGENRTMENKVSERQKQLEIDRVAGQKLKEELNATQLALIAREGNLSDKEASLKADGLKLDEQIKETTKLKDSLDKKHADLAKALKGL